MIFHFHQELCLRFASTYAVSKSQVNAWAHFRCGENILSDEFFGQGKSIKLQNNRGLVAVRGVYDQFFSKCATSLRININCVKAMTLIKDEYIMPR